MNNLEEKGYVIGQRWGGAWGLGSLELTLHTCVINKISLVPSFLRYSFVSTKNAKYLGTSHHFPPRRIDK